MKPATELRNLIIKALTPSEGKRTQYDLNTEQDRRVLADKVTTALMAKPATPAGEPNALPAASQKEAQAGAGQNGSARSEASGPVDQADGTASSGAAMDAQEAGGLGDHHGR